MKYTYDNQSLLRRSRGPEGRRGEAGPPLRRAELRPGSRLFLQRYAGNGGVQGLQAGEPGGLHVNEPGDAYEQEAEQVAAQVTSGPRTEGAAPRLAPARRSAPLQPEATASGHAPAPPIVRDVLRAPGQALDAETRAFMEPRFGQDFSQVRVHTDAHAAESARSVNALAYTVGRDLVFGGGQYAPATSEGRRLLAHELTHVVQQRREEVGTSRRAVQREAVEAEQPTVLETIGGGLVGEWNQDPTMAMVGADMVVSLIPILDQVSDIRDLVAHLYFMIVDHEYKRPLRWVGLVFSLIGFIPEIGSAIKSASKFLIKGALKRLDDLLGVLRRSLPWLDNIAQFAREVQASWPEIVARGMHMWEVFLLQAGGLIKRLPAFLSSRVRQIREAFAHVREQSPEQLLRAFDNVHAMLNDVIRQLAPQAALNTAAVKAASLIETGLDEHDTEAAETHEGQDANESVHDLDVLIEGLDLELSPIAAPEAADRAVIQRKPSPERPIDPVTRHLTAEQRAGDAFEEVVMNMLFAGEIKELGRIDHAFPGQFNNSRHGIDIFGIKRVRQGRVQIFRIEVKGWNAEVKSTKHDMQATPRWASNNIEEFLEFVRQTAAQDPSFDKRLYQWLGMRDFSELARRLRSKEVRSVVISPFGAHIKGEATLRRFLKRAERSKPRHLRTKFIRI